MINATEILTQIIVDSRAIKGNIIAVEALGLAPDSICADVYGRINSIIDSALKLADGFAGEVRQ